MHRPSANKKSGVTGQSRQGEVSGDDNGGHNDREEQGHNPPLLSMHGTAVSPMRSTTSSLRMLSAIAKQRRGSRLGVLIRSNNFCGRIRLFFPILSKRSSFWSPRRISSLHGPPMRARRKDQWVHFR